MRNIRIITALLAGVLLTLGACAAPAVTAAPPPLPAPVAIPPPAEVAVVPEPACPAEPTVVKLGLGPWSYAAEPVEYVFEITPASGQGGFHVSQLQAYPVELEIGDNVTVNVMVTNSGIQPGTYTVALKFNDAVIKTQTVNIDGGGSQKVALSVMPPLGEFLVMAGELSAGFKVVF